MPAAEELLAIDDDRAIAAAAGYVRGLCERHAPDGVILGLSGGLDSAVAAALAVRAIGPAAVRGLYVRDRGRPGGEVTDAGLVARWLGIELETLEIDAGSGEDRTDLPRGPALLRISGTLNRLLYRGYRLAVGETPLSSSLRAGGGAAGGGGLGNAARRLIGRYTEALFDERHRRRRRILESAAAARNLLPLGGANRSEWETGWFVRDGIDDLPHQPLIGLYKTQVRRIARRLGVPGRIVLKPPSPDMLRGIDDEFALGMSYGVLDAALDHLAGGVSAEEAGEAGATGRRIETVRELRDLSAWKRRRREGPFPVDGGPAGGLRLRPGH